MTAPAGPGLASRSATAAFWTMISRASGFARVAVSAAVLGPTFLGNTFQAANVVPNLLFYLLAGTLVSSLLVPALTRHLDVGDRHGASRVAGGFTGIALPAMVVLAVAGALAIPLVTRGLTSGIDDPSVAADQRRAGSLLLLLLLPQVVLYAIAAIAAAAQQATGRFGLAAGAPMIENFGLFATLLLAGRLGAGDPGVTAPGVVLCLGIGSTLSVAAHAAAQVVGARRAGISLWPRSGWRDDEVRSVVALAVPSFGYAASNVVKEFALVVAAARVAGGVVAFQVGYAFYNLVGAIGARTVGTAALADLTRAADDDQRFGTELRRALALTMSLVIPAGVAVVVLARPFAGLVSFGGMDSIGGRDLVGRALLGVGAGIVFDGAFSVLSGAAYARRRANSAAVAMVIRAAVTCLGLVVASLTLHGPALLVGLGLSVVAGDVLGTAVLSRRLLWRSGRRPAAGDGLGPAIARAVVASLAMAGPAVAAADLLGGTVGRRVAAAAAAAVGLLVVVVVLAALRSPELRAITDVLRIRRRPG